MTMHLSESMECTASFLHDCYISFDAFTEIGRRRPFQVTVHWVSLTLRKGQLITFVSTRNNLDDVGN